MRSTPAALTSLDEVGPHLRAWRDTRGVSQLDLSLDVGMSQRQISFIETGRSVPARANLLRIADALDVPFRERNMLLLAAGYAPVFAETGLSGARMQPVTKALQQMLKQHEPFPAFVLDRYWNVTMKNDAARRFLSLFFDIDAYPEPRNLIKLVFDPNALRPHLSDWPRPGESLLGRVARESVGRTLDDKARELIASLLAFPDVGQDWPTRVETDADPLVPLSFVYEGEVLRLFSLVSSVGSPQTIAAQELRVDSMFPCYDATERGYLRIFENRSG